MSLPVEQLANAFRELKIELEATRAETKELRQLLQAAKSETKAPPKAPSKKQKAPKAKPVVPRRSTGVRDSEGEPVYYSDFVHLLTSSTGGFFQRGIFQEGDIAEVYGITRINELKIRNPANHRDRTTRAGDNVTVVELSSGEQ